MTLWQTRIPTELIPEYAKRYSYVQGDFDEGISRRVKQRGEYTFEEFLAVCEWKTQRQKKRYRQNSPTDIQQATRLALSNVSEPKRIDTLRSLHGVEYPVASVLLHFGHRDPYPILDRRAIWSLGFRQPTGYSFRFWMKYLDLCRNLANEHGLLMRELDRALWQYSKEHQPKL
jgi:hypothetical protein